MKIIVYIDKVYLPFRWLNCRYSMVNRVLVGKTFHVGWPAKNFSGMHMREDKICWKDLCWSIGIVFTLKKWGIGNLTMSERMWGHEVLNPNFEFFNKVVRSNSQKLQSFEKKSSWIFYFSICDLSVYISPKIQ